MKKTTVIETLDSFEEEFDTEKLIERLLFVEKVEKGLKDVAEGKVMPYKEARKKFIDKILKSRQQAKEGETRIVDIDNI